MAEATGERRLELASGTTLARVEGTGRPFVWAHGFLGSMAADDALGTSALVRRLTGAQLVRFDARGHGGSAAGRDVAAQHWSALAGDLIELCDALALDRPVIGGASMGTATALHAALRAPRRFKGLVLFMPPTAWATRAAQADLYRGGAQLVRARGVEAYVEAMRAAFRANPIPGMGDELVESLAQGFRALGKDALEQLLRGAAASDLPEPEKLRGLDLPALVMPIRNDPGHPLSTAERLAELMPQSELVVLDDLRDGAKARAALESFLAKLSGTTTFAPAPARAQGDIDLYDPDRYAVAPPYEDFARLRRERPVWWQRTPDGGGYWAVLKHADVIAVSRAAERFSSARGFVVIEELAEAQLRMMRFTLLGMDPPEHARFRRVLAASFTPRIVAELEPRVRALTRAIVARAARREQVEFVEELAAELPMQVIGELLGVPEAERPRVRAWAAQLTGSQDATVNPGGAEAAPSASIEMAMYAIGLAQARRGKPGSDLTTLVVNAVVEGETMNDAEFGGFFVQLATAGNDTTRNLLGSGLRLLLESPAQLAAVRADPTLLPGAIEEMLRCESPLHYFRRTATRDTELRGQAIRAGERVVLYYGSANRDEDVFRESERFDIRRSPNPHLSFGIGPHFCLGAALARLEARVFFEELFAAFPVIELAGEPRRQRSNLNNALASLPLRLGARAS